MSNIFRSKEVFKKLRKEVHDGNTIVPVYGLYVSGEYKPPFYVNPSLVITDVSSKKAKVVNFGTQYKDASDTNTVGLLSFDCSCSNDLQIVAYTSQYKDASDTNTVGLLSFDCPTPLQIYSFEKEYIDASDTNTVGLFEFNTSSDLSFTVYKRAKDHMTPDPQLRITNIETTKATVTKYME